MLRRLIERSFRGFLAAALLALGAPAVQAEVTVFAAASLKTALDEALRTFEAQTGIEADVSYAGSSVLARQIALGAPADLFISANVAWMDQLDQQGLIAPQTRQHLLGNRLVVVAHGQDAAPLPTLEGLHARLSGGKLAMALIEAVPAGIYGKAALERAGLWADLAPDVAQTDNVRAALALVATGAAPLGIVYATDARAETRVSTVHKITPALYPPITYPIALIDGAGAQARTLLSYLGGPDAAAIFDAHGFLDVGE